MPDTTFWRACARYCTELAPVAGPLLAALADFSGAVDRASTNAALQPATTILPLEDD
jgi:hypothetical protein